MECAEGSREPGQRECNPLDDAKPKPPPIRTTSPSLATFVLYAERSIRLGERGRVQGGDVGVHAVSQSRDGSQVRIGACSVVDECRNVYSPSVRLGDDVTLGILQTNLIEDDSILLRSPVPFPAATMPPPPLAPAPGGPGANIAVVAGAITALLPGTYGALTVIGTVILNPGIYSFTSATLTDGARLVAITGDVQIGIACYLTVGRRVRVFPAFHGPASRLAISVSGTDGTGSGPAISLGENCFIRALLSAPHGTLAIADRTHATGAFAAFDIAAGHDVLIDFQSGFPPDAAGQRGTQQLQGYYGPNPNPTVAPLAGPVPADTIVPLAIGLPVRDRAGLQNLIKQVSDPKSPNFRQYLTQAQFTATYGATDSDYQALKDWATDGGLSIYATFPNNLLLCVSGTAAQLEQALYVNLVYRLRPDGGTFVAVDRDPSLDLAVSILQISGLTEFRLPETGQVTATGGCPGANCGGSYRAADIRNAYLGPSSELLNLDGTGQVVGLLELDSYTYTDIAGYDQLQTPQIDPTNVVLSEITVPPLFASGYQNSLEVALDIEMVQAMAPAAKVLVFITSLGITLHGDAVLHSMANSNPPLTSASCSWTFGRSDNSQQALEQMAANGVSFFTLSWDYGDIGDPQNNLDMLSQTLVGGTNLATNALPPFTFPPTPPFPPIPYPNPYYAGETTWSQGGPPKSKDVTGGGIMNGKNQNGNCNCWPYSLGPFSCCGSGVPIPDWQIGIMEISAAANGGSTAWRNYPDVAMLANNIEIFYGGQTTVAAGTSASAPLWAGFMALVNQRIKKVNPNAGGAGFVNTTLYDIGLTSGLADDLYQLCFNDIEDGVSNANGFGSGFKSVAGYDLCTGLGTPKPALIYQLSSPHPLTKDQPLDLIRFVIGTGHDNLRGNGGLGSGCGGTGCTADVFFPGFDLTTGVGVMTVTLKPKGGAGEFANNSTTPPIDFAIKLDNAGNRIPSPTPSNGIKGVRINIQEDFTFPCTPDNWDIASLQVWLFNPPFSAESSVCQLNLVGTSTLQDGHVGLVRLSDTAGSSGVGPSSPMFSTGLGSGCP